MKFKTIRKGGTVFLHRVNLYIKKGSIKIHLIMDDDKEDAHMHPWDFNSFLFLGAYKEIVDGKLFKHLPFTLVRRKCTEKHQVKLYRIFGLKIPCLTIGRYSEKKQQWCEAKKLCDFCSTVGYCVDKKEWEDKSTAANKSIAASGA